MRDTANIRRHERVECDTKGRAMWVDQDGRDKWAIVRIYDLSERRRQRLDAGLSAALVLMMTGPGLALFYGGLVRRKNVLGTMMHSFILMAVVTVIWAVVGYSLAFGGASPYRRFAVRVPERRGQRAQRGLRGTIPHADLHGLPVDVRHHHAGADLRRLRRAHEVQRHAAVHRAVDLVVYFPMAHMVWGKGGLLNAFPGGRIPVLRFRRRHGGAHHLGRLGAGLRAVPGQAHRVSRRAAMKPHNLVISFIGACLLWVGWFGFNAGSALAARGWPPARSWPRTSAPPPPRSAGWPAEWMDNGKPSVLGGISGCVAGLVAITPASGFVKPFPALLIGACAGVVCYFMVTRVKNKFGYDDSPGRLRRARRGRNAGRPAHRRLRHQRRQRRA
jgi:Amt family ammonium transporter